MNHFFFGRSSRQLFGAYDPPEITMRDQGIVICPPLGHEYLHAHPTIRFLARKLAASGFHVLRFDYSGTGDSASDFEDTGPASWLEDIEMAISEMKDVGQVSRVGLVGMRFGGTLAACVARDRDDVDQLVLWDAPAGGGAYLEDIGAGGAPASESVDASGVLFTPSMRKAVAEISSDSFAAPLPRTLIMTSGGSAAPARTLCDRLIAHGVECEMKSTAEEAPWRERHVGAGAMPVATASEIVSWLE